MLNSMPFRPAYDLLAENFEYMCFQVLFWSLFRRREFFTQTNWLKQTWETFDTSKVMLQSAHAFKQLMQSFRDLERSDIMGTIKDHKFNIRIPLTPIHIKFILKPGKGSALKIGWFCQMIKMYLALEQFEDSILVKCQVKANGKVGTIFKLTTSSIFWSR